VSPIRLTREAARNVEETGADVERDWRRLRDDLVTFDELLAECLDGADPDRVQGWEEYVSTLAYAASQNQRVDLTEVPIEVVTTKEEESRRSNDKVPCTKCGGMGFGRHECDRYGEVYQPECDRCSGTGLEPTEVRS
jgi:hypothetical protein